VESLNSAYSSLEGVLFNKSRTLVERPVATKSPTASPTSVTGHSLAALV
jgi:hypothetical protein